MAKTPSDFDDIVSGKRTDSKKRLASYKRKRFRNKKYRNETLREG